MKKLFYAHSNRNKIDASDSFCNMKMWQREIANKCVYCMNYALIGCSTFFAKFDQEIFFFHIECE